MKTHSLKFKTTFDIKYMWMPRWHWTTHNRCLYAEIKQTMQNLLQHFMISTLQCVCVCVPFLDVIRLLLSVNPMHIHCDVGNLLKHQFKKLLTITYDDRRLYNRTDNHQSKVEIVQFSQYLVERFGFGHTMSILCNRTVIKVLVFVLYFHCPSNVIAILQ